MAKNKKRYPDMAGKPGYTSNGYKIGRPPGTPDSKRRKNAKSSDISENVDGQQPEHDYDPVSNSGQKGHISDNPENQTIQEPGRENTLSDVDKIKESLKDFVKQNVEKPVIDQSTDIPPDTKEKKNDSSTGESGANSKQLITLTGYQLLIIVDSVAPMLFLSLFGKYLDKGADIDDLELTETEFESIEPVADMAAEHLLLKINPVWLLVSMLTGIYAKKVSQNWQKNKRKIKKTKTDNYEKRISAYTCWWHWVRKKLFR